MSARKDAMARLLALVGAETAPLGQETAEWRSYRRKVVGALRALLRERADAAADAARTLTGQLRSWEPVRAAALRRGKKP